MYAKTISREETTIDFNGKLLPVMVKIKFNSDDFPEIGTHFDLGSDEENEKEMARFERGEMHSILLSVSTNLIGHDFEGTDNLGMVFVRSAYCKEDAFDAAKENQMVENAKSELVNKLNAIKKLITE